MAPTANVMICGAGIASIAAAYHLTVRQGVQEVPPPIDACPIPVIMTEGDCST